MGTRYRLLSLVCAGALLAVGAGDLYWALLRQYAWVALCILVPLAGGVALRHWSAFVIPVEAMAATYLVGQLRLRTGLAFGGVPVSAQQQVVWLTAGAVGLVTAFFVLAGLAIPRAWGDREARPQALLVTGCSVAVLVPLALGAIGAAPADWWPRDAAAALLILAVMVAASFVLRRWEMVPILTLVAWLTVYGLALLAAVFGPPQPPGETLVSAFLESWFWVIVPLTLGGALGTGIGQVSAGGFGGEPFESTGGAATPQLRP